MQVLSRATRRFIPGPRIGADPLTPPPLHDQFPAVQVERDQRSKRVTVSGHVGQVAVGSVHFGGIGFPASRGVVQPPVSGWISAMRPKRIRRGGGAIARAWPGPARATGARASCATNPRRVRGNGESAWRVPACISCHRSFQQARFLSRILAAQSLLKLGQLPAPSPFRQGSYGALPEDGGQSGSQASPRQALIRLPAFACLRRLRVTVRKWPTDQANAAWAGGGRRKEV